LEVEALIMTSTLSASVGSKSTAFCGTMGRPITKNRASYFLIHLAAAMIVAPVAAPSSTRITVLPIMSLFLELAAKLSTYSKTSFILGLTFRKK
jgi:hypothetical protein